MSDLEEIYRSNAGDVMRFVRVSLGVRSAFDAEDLCQEAFGELLRQWRDGRFDRARAVVPYVCGIARKLVLRRKGRTGGGRELPIDPLPEPPLVRTQAQRLEVERNEESRLFAEFRATLDDRERSVLSLYYDDDVSQQAVGEQLGLSRDQVYRIASGIRQNALDFFRARGWFDGT